MLLKKVYFLFHIYIYIHDSYCNFFYNFLNLYVRLFCIEHNLRKKINKSYEGGIAIIMDRLVIGTAFLGDWNRAALAGDATLPKTKFRKNLEIVERLEKKTSIKMNVGKYPKTSGTLLGFFSRKKSKYKVRNYLPIIIGI